MNSADVRGFWGSKEFFTSLHTLLGRSDNDCMTSDVALEMPAKLSLRMAQECTTFVSKRDLRAQSVGFSRFS